MKHSLQKRFHDFVKTHELVKKGQKVLLAVSGGLDSMVLSQLFFEDKIPFAIAHCNFHLRGSESDGDEAFVIQWAESHGVDCYVRAFDLEGGSVQLEARNARYAWFWELMREHGFEKLATAHHLNDSFETLLINLVRGTGITGLAGIRTQNDSIIRPLLFATKEELRAYAGDQNLSWREDSSNSRADYDRNRIRLDIIPLLESLNPSLMDTYRNTRERLQYASESINCQREAIMKEYFDPSEQELSTRWINAPSDQVILAAILEDFGFNYATSREVFQAVGKPGKRFNSEGFVIQMDRDSLFLTGRSHIDEAAIAFEVPELGHYKTPFGSFEISVLNRLDAVFTNNENEAFLDLDRITFPLIVRNWRQGDQISPLGMTGSKKVSDLLIDQKVPLAKKPEVSVVETGGNICWIPGIRVSDAFKVTESTQKVLHIIRR